jgi:hypothetical protein
VCECGGVCTYGGEGFIGGGRGVLLTKHTLPSTPILSRYPFDAMIFLSIEGFKFRGGVESALRVCATHNSFLEVS